MREQLQETLTRALLSVMMALGLLMPMLGMLGLLSSGWLGVGVVLPVTGAAVLGTLLCGRSRLHRVLTLTAGAVILVLGLLYAFSSGAMGELFVGLQLYAAGQPLALSLIAGKVTAWLAVAVALLSFFVTSRQVGGFPAVLVLLLTMLGLWLSECGNLLLLLTPAAAATLSVIALSRSEELRARRVLPMLTALTLAVLAAVPAGGVAIPPLKEAADQLRQRILDYFFFTETRNVFTLAVEGYYPMGNGQLGGPAKPSDRPVMAVYTPRTVYLRGSIRNEYTGLTWQDTTGGPRYLWASPRWRSVRDALLDADLPAGKLRESSLLSEETINVRMVNSSQSSLFVPQRLRSLSVTGSMVPYFNNAGEVFITRDLEAEDTYRVTGALTVAGDPGLEALLAACEQSADPQTYERIRRDYSALPGHLQSQVFEIAQRAVAGAQTPYEKALALQNWLRQHYAYTLDVADQPEDVDFVSYFLLVSREGYCTYFASAMTVLARMAGLPSRYVEGYLARPGADGIARVTGKDGHAWTEIYFAGYGWLTFDATPPQGMAQPPADDAAFPPPPSGPEDTPTPPPDGPEEIPTPSAEPENSPPPDSGETPQPEDEPEGGSADTASPMPPLWPWLLLVLAAAAALAWRIRQTMPGTLAARCRDKYAAWLVWMQALTETLAAHGHVRAPSESLSAFLHRLASTFQDLPLGEIGDCSSEVLYGDAMPEEPDLAAVRTACRALEKRLKLRPRLKLILRRTVTPVKKRNLGRD